MKLQNLNFLKSSLWLFTALTLIACKKDEQNEQRSSLDATQLNNYVAKLPSVKQMTPFSERLLKNPTARTASFLDGAQFASAYNYYEQAKEYDNQLLYTENDEVFYPGALVKAQSAVEGSYKPIVAPRKPITISVSLTGSKPSIKVDNPSLSTVRTAISELLNRSFNPPPANITYHSYEVHDEQHLKLALGASYNGAVNTVKGSVNFNYEKQKTRYIVKIEQEFYTVDVDIPQKASDFFSDDFDYKTQFGAEKPVYVSSIKYGRVYLLGIESNLSKVDLEAKINASILSGKFTADAELAYKELSKSSKISGRVFGGSAKLAGEAIGDFAAVRAFLKDGAAFSKDNLGAPLSYRLRELGSNETFKTVIYSKYLKNDSGNIDNKKLDFKLLIKEESLKNSTGNKIDVDHYLIERFNPKSASQGSPSKDYLRGGELSKEFLAFEKGEKIYINVITKNKKRLFFKIEDFTDLVQRAQSTPDNANIYDLDKGKGLQLKDQDNNILTVGIHNQKVKE